MHAKPEWAVACPAAKAHRARQLSRFGLPLSWGQTPEGMVLCEVLPGEQTAHPVREDE